MPKRLVIVESPAKARTLARFLGKDFTVDSSIGHIRDLPESASQIPAGVKKEPWARLGVNVNESFAPLYVVPTDKKKKVSELKEHMKHADELLLATDEDREGEAISWHLVEILKPKIPYHRMVFHEITREAVHEALEHTRPIDRGLVSAQETRRIVDRLFGYEISPLLWRKIKPKLSAGRVQSVAIRMIVDRERARIRFRESAYWDLEGTFATARNEEFGAKIVSVGGKRVAQGKDFNPDSGAFTGDGIWLDAEAAAELVRRLSGASWRVDGTETKTFIQNPPVPFTTSTLQQEGSRQLRFTARRTMQVAQRLYENGHITYMRTDSTSLSAQAIQAARKAVTDLYGKNFLSAEPRQFKTRVKNAQEAHEAIRPAGDQFVHPGDLKTTLDHDEMRLYELIWKRTMACQMAEAQGRRMTARLAAEDAVFQATGKVIDFPGFLRVYVEGSDDPEAELAERDEILPPLHEGDPLRCAGLDPKEHRTQPPARFTEASLVKEMEAQGIGRPSTYASIIDTIERREYTFKRGQALIPTYLAFAVVGLLEQHFAELVDMGFTARMEDDLDAISRGEAESLPYLKNFYFGNGQKGLRPQLDENSDRIDPRTVCTIPLGRDAENRDIVVRVGRYGPFLQRGEETAPIPDGTAPDELTVEKAVELLSGLNRPRVLGPDPATGLPVVLRTGRFGPYVQLGEGNGGADPKSKIRPKTQSLLKSMTPETVTLDTALALLSLPRVVGQDDAGVEITATYGRFGAYIRRGEDSRSLDDEAKLFALTLEEALALLAQPKASRFQRRRAEALRTLGPAPALGGAEIKLMSGPYGLYVSDGTTNASVPKDKEAEAVTLEEAVALIQERAARGPAKGGRFRRKGSPRGAAGKGAPRGAAAGEATTPAGKAPARKAKARVKKVTARKVAAKKPAKASGPAARRTLKKSA